MKVELIDYTGKGMGIGTAASYAATLLIFTKNTRLEMSAGLFDEIASWPEDKRTAELAYIANSIRSSWEMVDYTFLISGVTRAFTHQLVRTRTASYAQQAQRVVDMSEFEALRPATFDEFGVGDAWDTAMTVIAASYREAAAAGVPKQDCRGLLPTNILTNIMMKCNLRTLADIVGKRENLRAQGEFADVVRGMKAAALEVHPWIVPFINPDRTATPALNKLLAELLGSSGPLDKPEVNEALKELDKLKAIWG